MSLRRFSIAVTVGLFALCLSTGLGGYGLRIIRSAEAAASIDVAKASRPLTLRLAGGNTGLPNPFRHAPRGPGMSKMQILYDSLLEKDEVGNIPWLAKSWSVNGDGTVYTFHLQENSLWHDGQPLTAEDVVFTLSYYRDHPPVVNDLLVGGEHIVKDMKVVDAHTVEVTFNRFDHSYLARIGGVRIIPKHIWENVDDPMAYGGEAATVGSGPYKLDIYDAQQGAYRYVAFEDYWGPKPAAVALEWVPVSDGVLAFENKEIDLINAPADILPIYRDKPGYAIKTAHSFHSYRLMMNMEAVEPLRDVSLRKALVYGINRQDLVDKAARGSATVSSQGYVLPVSPWYNENIEQYDYDADRARALLDGRSYSFKLLTDNSPGALKVAELIKLSLADVGVGIKVESVEAKTRDNTVNTGEYELLLINSGGMGGDPDYLRNIYGSGNKTIKGWSSPEIVALIDRQSTESDEVKRKELIFEIQSKIADEVPMILLHGAVDNFVFRPETYDGWMFRYDHSKCDHNKLSYLIRE